MQLGNGYNFGDFVDIDIKPGAGVGDFLGDLFGVFSPKKAPAPAPTTKTRTKTSIQKSNGIDKKWIIGGSIAAGAALLLFIAMKKKK